MRLDKFIAQQLGVSRAIAGREIRGNRVTVDGEIVRNAELARAIIARRPIW